MVILLLNNKLKGKNKMNKTIKVQVKQVYGMERIYPICEISKLLNNLMPTKTFTVDDLINIKKLGYEVESVGTEIKGVE
jgi:hypothetical protein